MQHALALEGQHLALDLYALLRDIDPAAWKDDLVDAFRARLDGISKRLDALLDFSGYDDHLNQLRELLAELARIIDEGMPSADLPTEALRAEWDALRREMLPAYEALVRSLKPLDVHVPSLRPTNYARNVFHVAGGIIALLMIELVLTPTSMLVVACLFATSAWTMEISRRVSPAVNARLMALFGRVAHPHEAHRVNSSTWYATALVILALTSSPTACALAVLVLGVGDPAAALIGRRFGRTKLINGRSLEGTLAFVVAAGLASAAMLSVFHPALIGTGSIAALAAGAAVPAALTELFSRRVDDNLSIPLAAAAGAGLVGLLLGVL
ncbi:MAG: hypothetical protein H6739_23435 [Alphaproteobacteria bacterium]|nr:hypothetical protein [Alphaproteobacteria bacterium]